MKGIYLSIYVHQFQKHDGVLLYEWLLEKAKKMGLPGGSAFLSLAGFGHHQQLHEQHFYELSGGNLSVAVSFALSEKQANDFLKVLKKENVKIFYVKSSAEYGFLE